LYRAAEIGRRCDVRAIRQSACPDYDRSRRPAGGKAHSGRMPDASACYPFATQRDFGVAAYANTHDGMGITCIIRVRVFVNPQKRTLELSRGMCALCPKP